MPRALHSKSASVVMAALVLVGCTSDPYAPVRARIERAGKLASICLRDVGHVPFEHSGNCIGASAYFWDREARKSPEFDVCFEENSAICHQLGDRESDILGSIHASIALSLFQFGKPRSVLREEREGTHNLRQRNFNFFRSMPDLRLAFAGCLASHPDLVEPQPSVTATEVDGKPVVAMPPLANHDCIHEGVDLFGFRPLP